MSLGQPVDPNRGLRGPGRAPSMIIGMIRQFVISLLMIGAISGQATPEVPKIRIIFPNDHSEMASLTYGLLDAANDDWHLFNRVSMQRGHSFLEILAETDRFKALVWSPGCQMRHFDVPVEKSNIEVQFACDPLKTVPFQGRAPRVDVGGSPRISVAYLSPETLSWFYDWKKMLGSFGEPAISGIATAPVSRDGSFRMELPDLAADPIASRDSWAAFEFRIIGTKGQHLLRPQVAKEIEGVIPSTIQVAPSYPVEVTFK